MLNWLEKPIHIKCSFLFDEKNLIYLQKEKRVKKCCRFQGCGMSGMRFKERSEISSLLSTSMRNLFGKKIFLGAPSIES